MSRFRGVMVLLPGRRIGAKVLAYRLTHPPALLRVLSALTPATIRFSHRITAAGQRGGFHNLSDVCTPQRASAGSR